MSTEQLHTLWGQVLFGCIFRFLVLIFFVAVVILRPSPIVKLQVELVSLSSCNNLLTSWWRFVLFHSLLTCWLLVLQRVITQVQFLNLVIDILYDVQRPFSINAAVCKDHLLRLRHFNSWANGLCLHIPHHAIWQIKNLVRAFSAYYTYRVWHNWKSFRFNHIRYLWLFGSSFMLR